MLASFPASILNQIPPESGNPLDSIKKQDALGALGAPHWFRLLRQRGCLGLGPLVDVLVGRFLGQAQSSETQELIQFRLLDLALVGHDVLVALRGFGKHALGPPAHLCILR